MTTRTRRKWKPDSRGYYTRQIGWVVSKSGKNQQQKFLLGKDLNAAETRERKLRELWDRHASQQQQRRPLWPDDLLEIGKLIARGVEEIAVPQKEAESQIGYAGRIRTLQASYPVVLFLPANRYSYDVGCAALQQLDEVPGEVPSTAAEKTVQQQLPRQFPNPALGNFAPASPAQVSIPINGQVVLSSPKYGRIDQPQTMVDQTRTMREAPTSAALQQQSLHDALKGYQEFIQREYFRPELNRLTDWGNMQKKQVKSLKEHHEDRLLLYLDADAVNEMIGYWRRRPTKKGTSDPMKAKSAGNYLSALIRFFKWLHNSSSFHWSKPFALNDANRKIQTLPSDHANRQLEQVDTFSLSELCLLMRYAQPLDRLLLLLAINCGFGRAEIASLLVRELRLFEAHSKWHSELINYESTSEDSFVKRIRRKSGVYGEHILFPMTVEGIQWAIEERKNQPNFSTDARLLLNKNGKPYDEPTKSGNANQTIPNRFARLIKRIKEDGKEIRSLSFGKLRKTAGQLIKTFSDGEIMGVFDCHGQPVKTDSLNDVYSNRPFGRVFKAIKQVEEYLEPVFALAGPAPFERQAEAYTKRSTIDKIVQLREAGKTIDEISDQMKLAKSTISRHLNRHKTHNEHKV